jgi:hypothetical protein
MEKRGRAANRGSTVIGSCGTAGSLRRRDFLKLSAAGAAGLAFGSFASGAPDPSTRTAQQYITCFYQFTVEAIQALSAPSVLPNGDSFLHLFTESGPVPEKRVERHRALRAAGPSFKYALCLDAKHYDGWQTSTSDQLKDLAKRYRAKALDPAAPSDYFAFNEMGFFGHKRPDLRNQLATWMRHVHDPHDGGPALQGVFYLTEGNLKPALWQGDADDFWTALDETCALVVGEHFHKYKDITEQGAETHARFLATFPQWLQASNKPARMNIAQNKYATLNSSYYGPTQTPWQGVLNSEHPPGDLPNYFSLLFESNCRSLQGQNRISFGPLNNQELDPAVLPALAAAFSKDVATFSS